MNNRAEIPATSSVVIPLPLARPRRLAEGYLAPVSDRAAALFFDDVSAGQGRQRLTIEADGEPVRGPLVSTSVPLGTGGRRHVLLLGHRADWLVRRRLVLALDQSPCSMISPDWLQSPITDVAALFEGLTDDGRDRLLRLFLTTGASLLGRGAAAGFARSAHRLLEQLGVRQADPVGWCQVGTKARIVTYSAPRDFDAARLGELVALSEGAISRETGRPILIEPLADGVLLHVFVAGPAPAGCSLVVLGAWPVALRLPDPETAPIPMERWLPTRDAATRAWAEGLLEAAATTDPLAHAVVQELRHRADPAPALAVRHMAGTRAGVLYSLRLCDPNGLVREARIARGTTTVRIPIDGKTASGYLPLPRSSSIDDRYRLALVYHSGRIVTVAQDRLAGFDGAAPAGLAPTAIAEARLDRERRGRALRTDAFGPAAAEPTLTVICPVGGCLDVIRARAALAFAEKGGQTVEFVYHVAEGPEAAAARGLLAQVTATFGMPHRLLVVTPDFEPADRLVAAAREAAAPLVLLLGADVLPSEAGWLAPWRRLSRRHPMLEAAVAGHDGRRESDAGADCLGFAREPVLEALERATGYGAPSVLVAETAELLRRQGTPAARLGLVFMRYGEQPLTTFEKSVDVAALQLILKRSFSNVCDEVTP